MLGARQFVCQVRGVTVMTFTGYGAGHLHGVSTSEPPAGVIDTACELRSRVRAEWGQAASVWCQATEIAEPPMGKRRGDNA